MLAEHEQNMSASIWLGGSEREIEDKRESPSNMRNSSPTQ